MSFSSLKVSVQDQDTGLWYIHKSYKQYESVKTEEIEHHKFLFWTWPRPKYDIKYYEEKDLRKMAHDEAVKLYDSGKEVRITECGEYSDSPEEYIKEVLWRNGAWL